MQSVEEKLHGIFGKIKVISAAGLVIFCSCSFSNNVKPTLAPDVSPLEDVGEMQNASPGSLFTSGKDNLFSDANANGVGDIITVNIVEDIKGSGSSTSKTSRESSFDLSIDRPTILGKKRPTGNSKDPVVGISTSPQMSFSGQGSTERKAKLVASLSARVVKVYPNGNLYISGSKIIKINDDLQILKISGIVKPTDIEKDNSVSSSKIANMYVEYNGKGYIADNQEPGWLAKLITKVWPF